MVLFLVCKTMAESNLLAINELGRFSYLNLPGSTIPGT